MTKQQEIFEKFTKQMNHELEVNIHKGDWTIFKNRDIILQEIDHHVNKLKDAILKNDEVLIKEHSADIANISLFMFNTTIRYE